MLPSFIVTMAPARSADVLNTSNPMCPASGTSYCKKEGGAGLGQEYLGRGVGV